MESIDLSDVQEREMAPGFKARFVHSDSMTFAFWEVKAGSSLPAHSHPHEQVVNVLEGKFNLTLEGTVHELEPGRVLIIPPNAEHGGETLTDCRILDVFHPVREDYR